jgi:hypothetical protein
MRATDAMGPEAAVLTARLAELRAYTIEGEPEATGDNPLWVEAAVRAGWEAAGASELLPERERSWTRVRRALSRAVRRGSGRSQPASGVASWALMAHDRR